MRNFITEKIENLTEEQLKQCWEDIQEYNKEGIMGSTLVRQIKDELAEQMNNGMWDISCRVIVIPEILYEIARRYYSK